MNVEEFIEMLEGKRYKAYKDSAGNLTIGVGHLITNEEKESKRVFAGSIAYLYENGLTDEEIYDLLSADIFKVEMAMVQNVKVRLKYGQRMALISFIFNVGENAFKNSHLLKYLNQYKFDLIPLEFMKWIHVNEKINKGLIKRRTYEVMAWYGEFDPK